MTSPARPSAAEIALAALSRRRHPVARLVSVMEDQRPGAARRCDEALSVLEDAAGHRPDGCGVIGVTGAPGSGKSSLLARVTDGLLDQRPDVTVAVIAIDPSSPTSKGALLGDRTRMNPRRGDDHRLFFRSQASANALGGLAPTTYPVCRALSLLYDCVIVETVGIGQSEADIRHLADRVYLVIAPLGGDEIQYLKAGIIEMPDTFIVNKWDEKAAQSTYHQLRATLWLARPFDGDRIPLHRTSARTGHGLAELVEAFEEDRQRGSRVSLAERSAHFFAGWVVDEWGRVGRRHLDAELGGAATFLASKPGFATAQVDFDASLKASMRQASVPDTTVLMR
jgi:LAO/AO transport system kinase